MADSGLREKKGRPRVFDDVKALVATVKRHVVDGTSPPYFNYVVDETAEPDLELLEAMKPLMQDLPLKTLPLSHW